MQILIQLHYLSNNGKALQQADFKVNPRNYKLDPDAEEARISSEWFKQIKRESINKIELYKVLYNQIDITEKVMLLII